MGSFQQGIQLGQNAYKSVMDDYQTSERLALEKEREARAAEKHGLEMSGLRRIDDATKALTDAQTLGVQVPGAQQANEGLQRQSLRQFEIAQQNGEANPQYVAPTGLQQTYRPAGVLDINSLQAALAAAKGDVAGMEALRLGRKGIEFDEGYKKHFEDWNKMDDAAKGDLINKLSYDAGVKGFGTWTPGKGKQAGYMTYLPPTGDPVKLSSKEAGDLYVLTNLMSVDPMRARAEMDKVSDKVRTVAAQAFDAQTKGVTANNTAAHYAAADANDAARTAAQGQYYGVLRDRVNRPQAGDLQKFQDSQGNAVIVDVTGLKRNADGTVQLPTGLRPINARPEMSMADVTARAKAYVESGMTDPDNPKAPLTMQKAVQLVQAEAAGGYKSAADRIIERLAAEEANKPQPANAATGIKPYNERLQDAYNHWQGLKAPWYLPTPKSNVAEREAERAYEELLRNPR